MNITPIARKHRSILERCHNGCKANADGKETQMGYRVATRRVWILGRPTPLCPECAVEWERIWHENLDRQDVAA